MAKQLVIVALTAILVYACQKQVMEDLFSFERPSNFPEPVYHFETNPITSSKFELGRKLFYEPRLSRDNTVSCASCHIQQSAFTHHGHDVSHGIDDRLGSRNSPAVMNMAWSNSFFWDGGVFDLDLQPIVPITNPVEMDETIENVLNKLRTHSTYPALFRKAFGSEEINTERMMKALSQFMVMMVSSNSKYDKVMRKQGEQFTFEEQAGYKIFQQKCSSCHQEPLFTDNSFRNNGIGIGYNNDQGRYLITLNEEDKYKFKVPSLRNLGFTSPYMHDGRFITIDAVLEQYNQHVVPLSDQEKTNIIAFLKTLDDKEFINDKRFSEP